jgi:hypothetical protein
MLDTKGLVLGELAVRAGYVTREQLEECIAHQEGNGYASPLGEVMMARGLLTKDKLPLLLERQKEAIADYEQMISVSGLFGRIAVERGFITERQLNACIRTQLMLEMEGDSVKIGQVMIRNGLLSLERFWEIIHSQGDFKCGACGHVLDKPRFSSGSIVCEKCGKPALRVDES